MRLGAVLANGVRRGSGVAPHAILMIKQLRVALRRVVIV